MKWFGFFVFNFVYLFLKKDDFIIGGKVCYILINEY